MTSLKALDLSTDNNPEGIPAPMLAAGASEDFADRHEQKRLSKENDTLVFMVTQCEEIIEALNARLKIMCEDNELLGVTIAKLQSLTTQEEKDEYLGLLGLSMGIES